MQALLLALSLNFCFQSSFVTQVPISCCLIMALNNAISRSMNRIGVGIRVGDCNIRISFHCVISIVLGSIIRRFNYKYIQFIFCFLMVVGNFDVADAVEVLMDDVRASKS
mgnify:CR=1 FL=1